MEYSYRGRSVGVTMISMPNRISSIFAFLLLVGCTDVGSVNATSEEASNAVTSSVAAKHELDATVDSIHRLDDAIAWLERKKAQDPHATEAAFQKCRAVGEDLSVTLNCMHKILGE